MLGEPEIAAPRRTESEDTGRTSKMTDIAERVKKIVVEHLGVEAAQVKEDARRRNLRGADRILGDDFAFVFDFHGQVVRTEERTGKPDDESEFGSVQPGR